MLPEWEVAFSGSQILSTPSVLETSNVDEKTQIYAISDDEKLETLEADFSNFKSLQELRKG